MNLFWDRRKEAELVELVRGGMSAGKIGRRWGVTRNVVIGKARRLGLTFDSTDKLQRLSVCARPPREPKPPRVRRQVYWSPERREAQRSMMITLHAECQMKGGARPHPRRVEALAAYLAGVSAPKAAREFGCSPQAIWKFWSKDERLIVQALPLAEAAKADAKRRLAERIEARRVVAVEQLSRRQAYNAPILRRLSFREASMCVRLLGGATLQEVADEHDLTRERIRQIAKCARDKYGLDFGGRFLGHRRDGAECVHDEASAQPSGIAP